MKILIILADNVYLTPYMKFYTNIFNELGINYKVVYWDKNEQETISDDCFIKYRYHSTGKVGKIFGYLKYRKFILKIMKEEDFNLLLPLQPILSFILFDVLYKKNKRKYIYDVRDYSYEWFGIFRWTQKRLVENSLINIISSNGYREFLPSGDYYIAHNIPRNDYIEYKQYKSSDSEKINISYIGLIRFMEQNKKIIDFFKNDSRYQLRFIGTNAKKLESYCNVNQIKNVTLIDTFDPKETLKYYDDTDLIMNLYGNDTPLLDFALSNKLYYAACLYKPILVCENTYMESVSVKNGIGYTLKMKSLSEKEELYGFIKEMNREEFIINCDNYMKTVYLEENQLSSELKKRLLNVKSKVETHD